MKPLPYRPIEPIRKVKYRSESKALSKGTQCRAPLCCWQRCSMTEAESAEAGQSSNPELPANPRPSWPEGSCLCSTCEQIYSENDQRWELRKSWDPPSSESHRVVLRNLGLWRPVASRGQFPTGANCWHFSTSMSTFAKWHNYNISLIEYCVESTLDHRKVLRMT